MEKQTVFLKSKIFVAECSIASILKIFGRPPLSTVIIAEWKTFAIYLDTPSSLTRRLKVNLQLDKDTLLDVVEELLLNWVLRQSKQANLGTLLKIVCQLNWNVMKGTWYFRTIFLLHPL